ncbi:MAG: Ig-like domain-containing protein, partial [Gemmatimonadaceae bacterium]
MRNHLRTHFALWCSLLVLVLLPACASFNELTGPTVVPGVVASVDIPTSQTKLSVGSTLALQAKVYDGSRNTIVDKSVIWTSSDSSVATVSAEGVVTGMGVGPVRIAASVQGRSAVANLTVTARTVASILVNPPSPSILVGATLQLSSVTLGESGDILAGRSVFWESSNPIVASIDNFGLLTGLAAGVTTITATSETRSASVGVSVLSVPVATVQISPATDTVVVGQTTQLTAVPRDSIGAPLVDRPIAWSSSNQAIATVSASGLVVGTQAGTVTITSSSEGKSGSSRIVVLARPVGAVIVSPAQISLSAGQTIKLTVLITDNNGTLLTGRPITYQSGNTNVATVATDGTVTGVKEGAALITVTSEGKTGTADVAVLASPVTTVRINTSSAEMAIGSTQTLSVTLLDASGNTLPARPIAWRSGAPSVASVASNGTVTALAAGTVVVFATVDGKLASSTLTVRAITATSVVIAPPTATVYVGDALDLGAQPRDGGGAVIAGKAVKWSSSDDRIAVVSSTGRVRALALGQVLITATVDGVSGSSAITTLIEPVLSVTIDPPTVTVLPGGSATLTATARGRNGTALPGRTFTFQSSDISTVQVSNLGYVTGLKQGAATITASSEGKSASVIVTVSQAPVASIVVSLPNPSRYVSQTTQATADIRDAGGVALSGRQVVWTSSNAAVASVSQTGLVTANLPGTADIIGTSGGKTGQATVTVSLVPISSVVVTLAQNARFVGQSTTATAATLDSIGGTLSGRPVVWASSNTAVATVTQTGVVSAIAPGTTNITATAGGKVGTSALTVTLVPVAKVVVTLGASQQFVGQTTTAVVTLFDANNNVLTGRAFILTSSDPSVATVVSATGIVTTVAVGSSNITAVSGGITGIAAYQVVIPPVASAVLTLPQPALYTAQTTLATVVLRDPLNRVLTGRVITFASSDLTVATVSAAGLVTGVNPGNATITATSEGIAATAAVAVTLIPVSTVQLTVPQSALQIGQTTQSTVVLKDVNGVTLTGRAVTWMSSNTALVTVSGTGFITAVAAGNAIVTATSEGVSATVAI